MARFFLIVFLSFPFSVFAQDITEGSLTVFSSEGEKFYVYLDGVRKNEKPESQVRVDGLTQLFYNVKIIFENSKILPVSKSGVAVSDGDDNLMDVTYKISKQNFTHKIRFYSMNPVRKGNAPQPARLDREKQMHDHTSTGSMTVFSEDGAPFFLYLNGVQQNNMAHEKIRIEGLTDLYYQVKVIFADRKSTPFSKTNVTVSDGDDILMDATYKAGRSKLKFYAMNPVFATRQVEAGTYVYQYGKPIGKLEQGIKIDTASKEQVATKVETRPTAKVDTPATPKPVKAEDKKPVAVVKETRPVKSTDKKPESAAKEPADSKMVSVVLQEPENWECGNEWPMWKADYAAAKKNIEETKNDKDKLAIAKKLASANCFNTDQVVELARLMSTEESRLSFVKEAFARTIDYKNYQKTISLFANAANQLALKRFLKIVK